MSDGQLKFTADEDCATMVEVRAVGHERALADDGDDLTRVGYGTFWYQRLENSDRCQNQFPLVYGQKFEGTLTKELRSVAAKPLLREVIYSVSTSTGSTGYGEGRFIIRSNGSVETLR